METDIDKTKTQAKQFCSVFIKAFDTEWDNLILPYQTIAYQLYLVKILP